MPLALAEFIGNPDTQHVQQPEGSEQCMAAIISAVSGAELHVAQAALYSGGMVEEDGTTGLIPSRKELEVDGSIVAINPLEEAADFAGMQQLMDTEFEAGRSVMLLHKKNSDPDDHGYHWTLFTGYVEYEGQKGALHTIDPLRPRATWLGAHVVRNIFERSQTPADSDNPFEEAAQGVFAYAISVEEAELAAAA